ncbi:MAG: hypothetical protein D6756_12195 [Cyanobacteria bacterium J083]|nr:MAG: hypothetical protein D6756_12195 [Cyanobacteria bacterium J083]
MIFFPRFSLGDFYWWFVFNPTDNPSRYREQTKEAEMGFLAAIFSFLFGDGDPNWDLEQRRWQMIGAVIRKNKGAVAAEQIAPYLDEISQTSWETEDYMLPVLSKFNGYPQVSPQGDIIYHFPQLQVKAAETKENKDLPSYLREHIELFSKATSRQQMLAIGLGVLNIVLAIALSILLQGGIAAELGGIVAFVASIYWFLLAYGIAFLLVPTVRYFWLKSKNNKIIRRNQERQLRAIDYNQLHLQPSLKRKIDFARQFATEKVISQQDITYSTEQDLLDQNIERKDKIEEEWRKMLDKD